MKTTAVLKLLGQHVFQTALTIIVTAIMLALYVVNANFINHKIEMMFASRSDKAIVAVQADNFKFINDNFGKETARFNYIQIMSDEAVIPEVKRIVRLAYAEHLKE